MNTMHDFKHLTLQTERLTLRPPVAADYAAFAADAAADTTGYWSESRAFCEFAEQLGHWQIRGYGLWVICEKNSDTPIGATGPYYIPRWDEAELGWRVFKGFEGKSIAFEAALAARKDTYERLGWEGAVSYIVPENTRSIKLAERLGAKHDKTTTASHDPECLVYRHPTAKECLL